MVAMARPRRSAHELTARGQRAKQYLILFGVLCVVMFFLSDEGEIGTDNNPDKSSSPEGTDPKSNPNSLRGMPDNNNNNNSNRPESSNQPPFNNNNMNNYQGNNPYNGDVPMNEQMGTPTTPYHSGQPSEWDQQQQMQQEFNPEFPPQQETNKLDEDLQHLANDEVAKEELSTAIKDSKMDIEEAEEEQVIKEEELILTKPIIEAKKKMQLMVEEILKMKGVDIAGDELEELKKLVAERLDTEVENEFREKAEKIAEEKQEEIDVVVVEDSNIFPNPADIEKDVKTMEKYFIDDMKREIDQAAVDVQDSLNDKIEKIEKEVIEEKTGVHIDDKYMKDMMELVELEHKLDESKYVEKNADNDTSEANPDTDSDHKSETSEGNNDSGDADDGSNVNGDKTQQKNETGDADNNSSADTKDITGKNAKDDLVKEDDAKDDTDVATDDDDGNDERGGDADDEPDDDNEEDGNIDGDDAKGEDMDDADDGKGDGDDAKADDDESDGNGDGDDAKGEATDDADDEEDGSDDADDGKGDDEEDGNGDGDDTDDDGKSDADEANALAEALREEREKMEVKEHINGKKKTKKMKKEKLNE